MKRMLIVIFALLLVVPVLASTLPELIQVKSQVVNKAATIELCGQSDLEIVRTAETQVRIAWESTTGAKGHGEWQKKYAGMESEISSLNSKWPTIHHYPEYRMVIEVQAKD